MPINGVQERPDLCQYRRLAQLDLQGGDKRLLTPRADEVVVGVAEAHEAHRLLSAQVLHPRLQVDV